ncbi:MAG: L,D-transpeptidase [Anaerolineae bacterium]
MPRRHWSGRWLLIMAIGVLALLAAVPALADPGPNPGADVKTPNAADWPAEFVSWVRVVNRTYAQSAPNGQRVQLLDNWDTWLGVRETRIVDGETWYRVGSDRWVYGDDTEKAEISPLRGYNFKGNETGQFALVVAEPATVYSSPGPSGAAVGELKRYTPTFVTAHDSGWLQVGGQGWVANSDLRLLRTTTRPAGVGPEDKWIDVDLTNQTVAAYQGDKIVWATLVSTGKDPTPTKTGVFYIYQKKIGEFMAGGWADHDPYILEEVPWTMYFTESYALHGAYWHDKFGEVRSHGCVNLTPEDAKFLFTWSGPVLPPGQVSVKSSPDNLGTWVYVHDSAEQYAEALLP